MTSLRTMLMFFAIVTVASGLLHLYIGRRLVRAPAWPAPWRRRAAWSLVALAGSVPLGLGLFWFVGGEAALPVSWVGSVWTGTMFLLVVILFAVDVLRVGASVVRRIAKRPRPTAEHRLRRARWVAVGTAALAGGLSVLGVVRALAPAQIVEVQVPIRRLPPEFEGFRIAHLTDLHAGPLLRRAFVADVVEQTNALEPDLVAITGDLVDGSVEDLREVVAPLAGLRAPHGVWFVTGNHEWYSGAAAWVAHLPTLGIRVLVDERVEIRRGAGVIDLAGIHDPTGERFGSEPDLDRALAGRDPARPVVLLAHQPRQVEDARRLGVDLQLAGHTHGGQMAPFGLLVGLAQPAVEGLHRFGDTWLYVCRGVGTWGPPMRLPGPGRIAVVTLSAPKM